MALEVTVQYEQPGTPTTSQDHHFTHEGTPLTPESTIAHILRPATTLAILRFYISVLRPFSRPGGRKRLMVVQTASVISLFQLCTVNLKQRLRVGPVVSAAENAISQPLTRPQLPSRCAHPCPTPVPLKPQLGPGTLVLPSIVRAY
jgi:hypothetical protein